MKNSVSFRGRLPGAWLRVGILVLLVHLGSTAGFGADSGLNLAGQLGGGFYDIVLRGNYAYAAEGASIVVLDISAPRSPVRMKKVMLPGPVFELKMADNLLYAHYLRIIKTTYVLIPLVCQVWVFDVSDPLSPKDVHHFDWSAPVLAASGHYAFIGFDDQDYHAGFEVYDMSQPASPEFKTRISAGYYSEGYPLEAVVSGDALLVGFSEDAYRIYDIADPAEPKIITGLYHTDSYDEIAPSV